MKPPTTTNSPTSTTKEETTISEEITTGTETETTKEPGIGSMVLEGFFVHMVLSLITKVGKEFKPFL